MHCKHNSAENKLAEKLAAFPIVQSTTPPVDNLVSKKKNLVCCSKKINS